MRCRQLPSIQVPLRLFAGMDLNVLLYMRSTRYNFAADLNLHFPPNSFDNVVDEESFTKIVNLESKPYRRHS